MKKTIAVLTALLFILTGCATGGGQPARLSSADAGEAVPDEPFSVGKVKRSGVTDIGPQTIAALHSGGTVVLELFPDARFTVTTTNVTRENGVVEWNGTVAEAQYFGAVMLAIGGEGALGTVQVDDRVFALRPRAGGTAVFEIDQAAFPPEAEPLVAPVTADDAQPRIAAGEQVLTVLLVMPKQYTEWCRDPFKRLNYQSSVNANLNQVWRRFTGAGEYTAQASVYCTSSYSAVGGDLKADLQWLRTDPGVAAARSTTKSDLVTMIVPRAEKICGRGNYNYPVTSSGGQFAFSVVRSSCALENYTLAHEIGHNLGMQHDRFVKDGGDPKLCNYGFTVLKRDLFTPPRPVYRTAMAYQDYCKERGVNCPRMGLYSAPVTEMYTFGIPCSVEKTGVDGSANNAGQFVIAAPVASAWQ